MIALIALGAILLLVGALPFLLLERLIAALFEWARRLFERGGP